MNFKTLKKRIERKEEAVKNLIEYFRREDDYKSIMTMMAMAQTNIMEAIEIARLNGYDKPTSDITEFFVSIQCLMIQLETLSDFAQIEKDEE